MGRTGLAIAAAVAALAGAAPSPAATPLSVRDSFRIGNAGTSFCSAQSLTSDKALTNMFHAGYSTPCRAAARAVGKLYKPRDTGSAAARVAADRAERASCAPAGRGSVAGLGPVEMVECKLKDADVAYRA